MNWLLRRSALLGSGASFIGEMLAVVAVPRTGRNRGEPDGPRGQMPADGAVGLGRDAGVVWVSAVRLPEAMVD